MAGGLHYAKTTKGIEEIGQRRNNLRGKMRMMLILVDPAKGAEQLLSQAAQIGVAPDCLEIMEREGYIAPIGARALAAVAPAGGVGSIQANDEEAAKIAAARTFMQQTLAAAVGSGADLAQRIERCSTRAALNELVREYERAIAHVSGDVAADMLTDRLRKTLK